jgi:hypothetical protein
LKSDPSPDSVDHRGGIPAVLEHNACWSYTQLADLQQTGLFLLIGHLLNPPVQKLKVRLLQGLSEMDGYKISQAGE